MISSYPCLHMREGGRSLGADIRGLNKGSVRLRASGLDGALNVTRKYPWLSDLMNNST
jgi:hypothetical protein